MYSREPVGKEWIESIWDVEGTEIKKERHKCPFNELDQRGDLKDCWFKASPQVCLLCLMGDLIEMLSSIKERLEHIE